MRNPKRTTTTATFLTLALATGLAACGTNNDDAAPADTAPPASASPSVTQVADSSATPSAASSAASPSESAAPSGPYEPATSKHPARNVPDPGPLPKVAKEKSKAGQVAFIEHWVKEFNYGLETNDLRPEFWEMTSKSCDYCQGLRDGYKVMQTQKTWNVGGDLTLKDIYPDLREYNDGLYEVQFTVTETPRKRFAHGKSKPIEELRGGTELNAFVKLRRVDGKWQMEGLYQVAE